MPNNFEIPGLVAQLKAQSVRNQLAFKPKTYQVLDMLVTQDPLNPNGLPIQTQVWKNVLVKDRASENVLLDKVRSYYSSPQAVPEQEKEMHDAETQASYAARKAHEVSSGISDSSFLRLMKE